MQSVRTIELYNFMFAEIYKAKIFPPRDFLLQGNDLDQQVWTDHWIKSLCFANLSLLKG